MVQVRWTFEAVRCLEGIHAYISSDVEEEFRGYLECGLVCFGFGRAL